MGFSCFIESLQLPANFPPPPKRFWFYSPCWFLGYVSSAICVRPLCLSPLFVTLTTVLRTFSVFLFIVGPPREYYPGRQVPPPGRQILSFVDVCRPPPLCCLLALDHFLRPSKLGSTQKLVSVTSMDYEAETTFYPSFRFPLEPPQSRQLGLRLFTA